jgi:TRAP-type C4-dicarboxylate transport system permease large subunit
MGHMKGGLSMATVVACGGFSAICGSSLATSATMAKVAMPPMRKYGYDDSLATASIAAGGTLGILIPPSVILVIYCRSCCTGNRCCRVAAQPVMHCEARQA